MFKTPILMLKMTFFWLLFRGKFEQKTQKSIFLKNQWRLKNIKKAMVVKNIIAEDMPFTKSIFEQFWRSYCKKTIFVVFHFLKFLPKYNVLGLRGCLCLFLGQCNAMMKAWQRKITPSLNFPFELGWKRQSWINKELNFIPKLFCHQTQTSDELNIIIWCCINC